MKILAIDPGGNSTGVSCLKLNGKTIELLWFFNVLSPSHFDIEKKNMYIAHSLAALIALERPNCIVSEKPWGIGQSKESLTQLVGAIKAELWCPVEWQVVSEARKLVAGAGNVDKIEGAQSLLKYPFDKSSKKNIKKLINQAKVDSMCLDVLDSLLHGVAFLIKNKCIGDEHNGQKG